MDGESHDQEWTDHKPGNTNSQQGQETADVVAPTAPARGGVKTEWYADPFRKQKSQRPERQRDGQPLFDNIGDGVVSIFVRRAEVAVQQVAEIAEILPPHGFVEMIFRLDMPLDLGRCRSA